MCIATCTADVYYWYVLCSAGVIVLIRSPTDAPTYPITCQVRAAALLTARHGELAHQLSDASLQQVCCTAEMYCQYVLLVCIAAGVL